MAMDFTGQLIILAVTSLVLAITAYLALRFAKENLGGKAAVFGLIGGWIGFVLGLAGGVLIGLSRYWVAQEAAARNSPWMGSAVDWLGRLATMAGLFGMLSGIVVGVIYVYGRGKRNSA